MDDSINNNSCDKLPLLPKVKQIIIDEQKETITLKIESEYNNDESIKGLVFRKMNINDGELFVKLRFDYFLMHGFNIDETIKDSLENNLLEYFNESIENQRLIGIICEYENKIASVAYLSISRKPPNPNFINGRIGTLLNVFTYPEYRKKGIAKELVKTMIIEAKKENIDCIELSSTKDGERLYKGLGFSESIYKAMDLKLKENDDVYGY